MAQQAYMLLYELGGPAPIPDPEVDAQAEEQITCAGEPAGEFSEEVGSPSGTPDPPLEQDACAQKKNCKGRAGMALYYQHLQE